MAIGLSLLFASCTLAVEVTIPEVPSYIWYHGCGPTAGGMVIGYWDAHGYEALIPGTNDWSSNNQAVKDMIASPGHIRDYVPTPDRVPTDNDPFHVDDCVADFNRCSRDPNEHGYSLFSKQDDGTSGYAAFRGYDLASGYSLAFFNDTFWGQFVSEIDAGRPVELLTDSNADGLTDHFVTAIGYDDAEDARRYACYNTWTHNVHWYDFARVGLGATYGIYGGAFFDPGPPPGDSNGDGVISGSDLAIWQQNYDPLAVNNNTFSMGDWNCDGRIDGGDLSIWQEAYSPVEGSPASVENVVLAEPGSLSLLVLGVLLPILRGRRRRS